MGRDKKTAKGRLDKYYHMAKEQGYRSRAAFKLIQLNQKFNFLAQSRCVLDLCAAPGGWMQVAQKYCPVSSLIIGVDLAPIKPVRNCIALQEDITTEKCRQSIKRELKNWKVDCVLHDGAPNVGTAWVQDAYTQVELSLRALQLATEMLREGGWFVTKVFRSKDYFSLMWVLNQLFKKVHATKPASSRNVSAEIFVVCQGYKAPASLDPRLLDPKFVFQDVSKTQDPADALLKKPKRKAAAEGYAEGVELLYTRRTVTDFVMAADGLAFLANASEMSMGRDDPNASTWQKHSATTPEIAELIKDIKVLGKKELRTLLKWRETLRASWMPAAAADTAAAPPQQQDDDSESEEELSEGEREQLALDDEVRTAQDEARRAEKARKRKEYKQKLKTQERLALRMDLPGDKFDQQDDVSLFNLRNVTSAAGLERVREVDAEALLADSEDEWSSDDGAEGDAGLDTDLDDDEDEAYKRQRERELEAMFAQHKGRRNPTADGSAAPPPVKPQSSTAPSSNPLLVSFDRDESASARAKMWFGQDEFKGLADDDEAVEVSDTEQPPVAGPQKRPLQTSGTAAGGKRARTGGDEEGFEVVPEQAVADSENEDSDSDSDSDMDADGNDGDDKEAAALDPHGLALGTLMLNKRAKRDMVDDAYNRHAFMDDPLPEWFADHESKFRTGPIKEVPKDMLDYYRDRMRELNARPIKKVAEAKARKKMKLMRKMDQMKKKMESVLNNGDVSDTAKARELERLMARKNKKSQRREVKYVVAKKSANRGRPAGVKGPYKMVDSRMKKDARALKRAEQRKGSKKGRR